MKKVTCIYFLKAHSGCSWKIRCGRIRVEAGKQAKQYSWWWYLKQDGGQRSVKKNYLKNIGKQDVVVCGTLKRGWWRENSEVSGNESLDRLTEIAQIGRTVQWGSALIWKVGEYL